jgi:phytanoyl-CoA hydroxylase
MLTSDQIMQYRQQGFWVCHGFLRAADRTEFLAEIDTILASATLASHDPSRMEMEPDQALDGRQARRIYEPCTYYQPLRQLSESQKLLDAVEQLIGPSLIFHYSKINMKPPAIGSVIEWHQDLT